MSWTQRVVDHLYEAKQCGLPFDQAWGTALARHRFNPSSLGVRGTWEAQTLFEQPEYAALEWYRGVCQAAYEDHPSPFGGPSRLKGLDTALRSGFVTDGSRDAGKPGRHRAAA